MEVKVATNLPVLDVLAGDLRFCLEWVTDCQTAVH